MSIDINALDASAFGRMEKGEYRDFEGLLEQHIGLTLERQRALYELVGEEDWGIDMSTGLLSFGEASYTFQLIGSLSFEDNSWMWGWANAQSNIPENLLRHSHALREIGQQKGMEELAEGYLEVGEGFDHLVGIIAAGALGAKAYYSGNYGDGALVMTLGDDAPIAPVDLDDLSPVLTYFPELISSLTFNHREVFRNYLIDRGCLLRVDGESVAGYRNGSIVYGSFDGEGRLLELKGKLAPAG
ncbi:MAG: hypothetical protein CSA07_01335 [Bacteroidia bacterium]|nr:MAG: hypothetical protein CSA07_01335 [Bacteroidia bacterium]